MNLAAYWQIFPGTIVGFLAVGLLIAVMNHVSIRRMDSFPLAKRFPRVSVLIPARNEEINIRTCVESLLAQEYPDLEVLALDDHSTDGTISILDEIAGWDSRLRVYVGKSLPSGWLGKHWACHQLSQQATGELLLFTDADTCHSPNTLRDAVSSLLARNADLLTAFPHEEMLTWGEKLTVPILSFALFSSFPILLAERTRLPFLSISIGQFMLFRRSAYEAIGGFEAVRDQLVDDVMLGRNIIRQGLTWRLVDATQHVTCRMYQNFSNAMDGFTKNLFAFFGHHVFLYCLGWFWISVSFLLPLLACFSEKVRLATNFPFPLAVVAVLEALLMFTLAYRRFRFPLYLVLLYPASICVFALIAFRSLFYSFLGFGSWKGREIAPPLFKL